MGLQNWITDSDMFEPEEEECGLSRKSFPCCACKHHGKTDADEPCRSCGHNIGATVSREVFSAFILHEDNTWEKHVFTVPAGTKESEIESVLLAWYGGFYVAGLKPEDDAREDIEPLM